jgi:hypothetical protein
LTENSEKGNRGRPSSVERRIVAGRGYNYELLLKAVWGEVGERVVGATSPEQVADALNSLSEYYRTKLAFDPLPTVIYEAVQYRDFPKSGRPDITIRYIARSIAAQGKVSHRRSRRICWEEEQADLTAEPTKPTECDPT